ncbi:hypothetical protein JM658_16430 [Joostella atrarenae]|uniref:Uncharacterized protein n=1 Tax=Joostella atrarenae TaxID=679257 RepID=A0ABS9J7K8_9FLAO|nr:hypothetical protein [Joostella atrarenae]MCF8716416.1 hypothetical protein [Joostella atrarenae]
MENKWIFYPWLPNSDLDHLIHPDDLNLIKANGIGVVKCLSEKENFLFIEVDNTIIRVKKDGILKVLPSPSYLKKDKVLIDYNQEIGCIIDFIWHHKDEKYYYFIEINGKKMKKRLDYNDLKKV